MERTGQSGAKVAISIFCNGLVDSYRYADGTLNRDWFDRERRGDAAFHIPSELHFFGCYTLTHRLNPQMPLSQYLYDKSEFERICRAHALPTIPVYAVFEEGRVKYQVPVPEEPLFSKPASASRGRGDFARWRPAKQPSIGTPTFRESTGEQRTLHALFEHLKAQSRSEPYLLQRLIPNHEAIRDLCGVETLNTLRLHTCCSPDGEVNFLPLAKFKVAVDQDAVVDNLASGGIGFVIDTDNGRLAAAGQRLGTFQKYASIPTTGKNALGFELPYWHEAVELCKTAHSTAFSTFPAVGWDVAITPDGPLLVEINIRFELPTGLPDEVCIGKTAYVDCVLAHIRRFWPDQLPPFLRS